MMTNMHPCCPAANLYSYLAKLNHWLFYDKAKNAIKDEMATKLMATLYWTKYELYSAYFDAIQNEQATKDL